MECLKICHDIKNTTIMEHSPVEQIAQLLDYYYPSFFDRLLDLIEAKGVEGIKKEFEVKGETVAEEGNYQQHLPELFWAVYSSMYRNINDIFFLNDYYLYLNFFLQFPRLTGQEIKRDTTFVKILCAYRNTKLTGSVYRFIEEVEYLFVAGKVAEVTEEEEEADAMIGEICEISRKLSQDI